MRVFFFAEFASFSQFLPKRCCRCAKIWRISGICIWNFAKMQFRPWRLIISYLQPRHSRGSGRYSCDSGRAAVPQMTHTPQLVNFYSYQLRSAWPAALRDFETSIDSPTHSRLRTPKVASIDLQNSSTTTERNLLRPMTHDRETGQIWAYLPFSVSKSENH